MPKRDWKTSDVTESPSLNMTQTSEDLLSVYVKAKVLNLLNGKSAPELSDSNSKTMESDVDSINEEPYRNCYPAKLGELLVVSSES